MSVKHLFVVMLFLAACKKKGDDTQPPPIHSGKCLVDRYIGPQAMQQNCNYEGYAWACTLDENTSVNTCNRGQEAASERIPVIEPPAVPAAVLDAGVLVPVVDAGP